MPNDYVTPATYAARFGRNYTVTGAREWLRELAEWRIGSIHRARLERAFLSLPEVLDGDAELAVHSLSRLGIWAGSLAADLDDGSVEVRDVADQLRMLARAGRLALDRMDEDNR
jgi:hypothetical protein